MVVEADRCVLTGMIGYHYYAGFAGGRKSVLPRISSYETIQANHKLLFNPHATTGRLKGNPVHEDMLEAASMLKPDFLVNLVLDESGEVIGIFAGDYIKAHEKGCNFVEKVYGCRIRERADLVIVSAGGYPKDINYYQAHKAFDSAFYAVKEGGAIILLAECREGLGPERFLHWLEYQSIRAIESELRRRFEVVGHNVYSTLLKAKKVRLIMVSSLPDSLVERMTFLPAEGVNNALNIAYEILGDSPTAYLMPYGYSTFPILF